MANGKVSGGPAAPAKSYFNEKKWEDAKAYGTGAYFEPGNYRVKVEAIKMVESQRNGDFYTVECKVLASSNEKILVGQTRSWQVAMKYPSAMGNIKQFLGAIADEDPNTIPLEVANLSLDPALNENFLVELDLECVAIKTREKQQDFTKHIWKHIG